MTATPRTPSEELRAFVVRTVVIAIVGLAFGLYALVGYLCVAQGAAAVPDALWLAAGTGAGTLGTLLLNSKGDQAVNTATVDVAAPAQLEPAPAEVPVVTAEGDGEVAPDLPPARRRR